MPSELEAAVGMMTSLCEVGRNASLPPAALGQAFPTGPFVKACMEAISARYYSMLAPLGRGWVGFFSGAYAAVSVSGCVGNGLILAALVRSARMRTGRNVFIGSLSLSNLLLSALLYPFLWVPAEAFHFPYGRAMCKLVNAAPASNVYSSTLTIAAISVQRFYSTKDTGGRSRHELQRQRNVSVAAALLIWALSLALVSPLTYFYETVAFPQAWTALPLDDNSTGDFSWPLCVLAPDEPPSSLFAVTLTISLLQISFLYLIPLGLLCVFNARLVRFIWANTLQKVVHHWASSTTGPGSLSGPPAPVDRAARSSQRRRNKTAILLITMALSYALFWLPYTLYTLLLDLELARHFALLDQFFKLFSMLSLVANPCLYGYLNSNFKRELAGMFSWVPWCAKLRSSLGVGASETTNGGGGGGGTPSLLSRVGSTLRPRASPSLLQSLSRRSRRSAKAREADLQHSASMTGQLRPRVESQAKLVLSPSLRLSLPPSSPEDSPSQPSLAEPLFTFVDQHESML